MYSEGEERLSETIKRSALLEQVHHPPSLSPALIRGYLRVKLMSDPFGNRAILTTILP